MLTSNGYTLVDSGDRLGRLIPVPERLRTDRDALWQRMRRDGHLFLTGLLDPDDVNAFRTYYFESLAHTRLVDPTSPGLGVASGLDLDRAALRRELFERIVPGREYEQLCRHPRIEQWFRWFLGDDVHLHRRRILRHTRAGENGIGTATQAHYDLVYLRGGTDRVLSMWIPLGDIPLSRGGLVYLEGSHRWVLDAEARGLLKLPAASITADLPGLADEHDARWLVTDYSAGDVVVHSAHIVHAALDNIDPGGVMRLSTDIRYQRESEPIDWRWTADWSDQDDWRWRVDQEPLPEDAVRLQAAEPGWLAG